MQLVGAVAIREKGNALAVGRPDRLTITPGPAGELARREPSLSTIQRLLARSSLTLSTQERVKTICLPSGEMAGLLTLSMSMKVSLLSVPLSVAPLLG
jgi:hypothetical protein